MKRYLLFAGNDKEYRPGMFSLVGDYATVFSALEACQFDSKECFYDWGHIFDTKTMRIVMEGKYDSGWESHKLGISEFRNI